MYRNAIDEERQRAHDETISDEHYWRTVVHEAAHCVIAERLQPGAALGMEVQRGQAGAWNGSATLDAPLGSRESALACLAGARAESLWDDVSRQARAEIYRDGRRLHTEPLGRAFPSHSDEREVEQHLDRVVSRRFYLRRQSERRELERVAGQLVRQNRRAIMKLATAFVAADKYRGGTKFDRAAILAAIS